MIMVMSMNNYINKYVRVITKVIWKNGREINIRYFGTVKSFDNEHLVLIENDGHVVDIKTKHIKRIEEYDEQT